jgi:hypothetical protein
MMAKPKLNAAYKPKHFALGLLHCDRTGWLQALSEREGRWQACWGAAFEVKRTDGDMLSVALVVRTRSAKRIERALEVARGLLVKAQRPKRISNRWPEEG